MRSIVSRSLIRIKICVYIYEQRKTLNSSSYLVCSIISSGSRVYNYEYIIQKKHLLVNIS